MDQRKVLQTGRCGGTDSQQIAPDKARKSTSYHLTLGGDLRKHGTRVD